MKILARYLLREFLRVLILTLVFFILVFFIIDFLEKIDNFIEAGVPMARVFHYYLMVIPSLLFYMAPVAMLVSLLVSIGLLARHSEIVVMKASGISLMRISTPFLLFAALFSLLMFVLSDTVIPRTSAEVNHIWNVEVEGQGGEESLVHRNFSIKEPDAIYNFQYYKEGETSVYGVKIFILDKNFELVRRVDAPRADFRDGQWYLINGLEKNYSGEREIDIRSFTEEQFKLPNLNREFIQNEVAADELSSTQLSERIRRMNQEGYDPIRYVVDLQFKYSFPFICLIMAIIGLPIAFWKEKGGGVALGIGVGIGLSFIYLVFLGLARSLGYSGALPPIAAAWLSNVVFTILGFYLFTHVRQ